MINAYFTVTYDQQYYEHLYQFSLPWKNSSSGNCLDSSHPLLLMLCKACEFPSLTTVDSLMNASWVCLILAVI